MALKDEYRLLAGRSSVPQLWDRLKCLQALDGETRLSKSGLMLNDLHGKVPADQQPAFIAGISASIAREGESDLCAERAQAARLCLDACESLPSGCCTAELAHAMLEMFRRNSDALVVDDFHRVMKIFVTVPPASLPLDHGEKVKNAMQAMFRTSLDTTMETFDNALKSFDVQDLPLAMEGARRAMGDSGHRLLPVSDDERISASRIMMQHVSRLTDPETCLDQISKNLGIVAQLDPNSLGLPVFSPSPAQQGLRRKLCDTIEAGR